ncbi:MAG: hypothetical protein JJU19_04430 [Pararhodobacter sp.]|nr:hypothetical protein [Pararhodobacter sp.]
MIDDDDKPGIVTSGKSVAVLIDGQRFRIENHRLKIDGTNALEVMRPETPAMYGMISSARPGTPATQPSRQSRERARWPSCAGTT